MTNDTLMLIRRSVAELAYRALDDAQAELETFEHDVDWYTASPKMMDRIEKALKALADALA